MQKRLAGLIFFVPLAILLLLGTALVGPPVGSGVGGMKSNDVYNLVITVVGGLGGATNGINMLNGFGTNTTLRTSIHEGHTLFNGDVEFDNVLKFVGEFHPMMNFDDLWTISGDGIFADQNISSLAISPVNRGLIGTNGTEYLTWRDNRVVIQSNIFGLGTLNIAGLATFNTATASRVAVFDGGKQLVSASGSSGLIVADGSSVTDSAGLAGQLSDETGSSGGFVRAVAPTLITPIFDDYTEYNEESAPPTPASGKMRVYGKTDGKLYLKNDSGTEYDLTGGGGSATNAIGNLDGIGTNTTLYGNASRTNFFAQHEGGTTISNGIFLVTVPQLNFSVDSSYLDITATAIHLGFPGTSELLHSDTGTGLTILQDAADHSGLSLQSATTPAGNHAKAIIHGPLMVGQLGGTYAYNTNSFQVGSPHGDDDYLFGIRTNGAVDAKGPINITGSGGSGKLIQWDADGSNTNTFEAPTDITTNYREVRPAAGYSGLTKKTTTSGVMTESVASAGTDYLAPNTIISVSGFQTLTNLWTKDGPVAMGTNYTLVSGATTCGVTGISNKSAGGAVYDYSELQIVCTGDITFTNHADFVTSDGVDTRTFTNGNTYEILVKYTPGLKTNLIYTWSR